MFQGSLQEIKFWTIFVHVISGSIFVQLDDLSFRPTASILPVMSARLNILWVMQVVIKGVLRCNMADGRDIFMLCSHDGI